MMRFLKKMFRKEKRNYPDFWRAYVKEFEIGLPESLEEIRFVVFDTETTGLDIEKDRILSIGALSLQNNSITVNQSFEVYLYQHFYHAKNIAVHGILEKESEPKITELEAIQLALSFIGNSVLVAHHAGFDRAMINAALKRHGLPKLKNKFLDTSSLYKRTLIASPLLEKQAHYSLDEMAEKFDIPTTDRHTALGDAYITAIAFLNILGKLEVKPSFSVKELLR
ncbi:DNA polymerase-3 subunit epsilon [Pricia antarctica]|uniref:DNA polymerase-3 subunit epsilon n=1 Tax=Pricia antarctica TaxID=641691 RepID=A0A1G7B5M3_9FLAO|nr:3'-5' exonuclease [Pricia antarctica]SDE22414.1 DNA polymerase-3 subunit epsilon [Pricia antarctica]